MYKVKPLIPPSAGSEVTLRIISIPIVLFGPGYTVNLHSDNEVASVRILFVSLELPVTINSLILT